MLDLPQTSIYDINYDPTRDIQESPLGYQVTEFQDTPNPNALKCVLDRHLPPLASGGNTLRSYQSLASASADPLAAALFAIPGVAGVLINPAWVTISKSPDAEWKHLKSGVKKVLGAID